MRLLSLAVLSCLLGIVYWVGATIYTDRIEEDITERSHAALAKYQPGLDINVDGRDVTVAGTATSEELRSDIQNTADSVWGVRKAATDQVAVVVPAVVPAVVEPPPAPPVEVAPPSFNFDADYEGQRLHMSGLVDDNESIAMLDNIHNALPPTTDITRGMLSTGAAPLVHSPQKLETGIAALTQLSKGDLKITDKDFILNGYVSDEERRRAIEQLLATRSAILEPLNVQTNIMIDPYIHVTQECRDAIVSAMQDSTLNYKVDYYNIEDRYLAKLSEIAITVNEVCSAQISQVLVEGHADVTGGEGYNQGLSENRANTVRDHLVSLNIPAGLIGAFGYGEFRPIDSNETIEGRSRNRRVEIHLSTDPVTVNPDNMQISINSED